MYSILEHYLSTNHILMIGMIVTFIPVSYTHLTLPTNSLV